MFAHKVPGTVPGDWDEGEHSRPGPSFHRAHTLEGWRWTFMTHNHTNSHKITNCENAVGWRAYNSPRSRSRTLGLKPQRGVLQGLELVPYAHYLGHSDTLLVKSLLGNDQLELGFRVVLCQAPSTSLESTAPSGWKPNHHLSEPFPSLQDSVTEERM